MSAERDGHRQSKKTIRRRVRDSAFSLLALSPILAGRPVMPESPLMPVTYSLQGTELNLATQNDMQSIAQEQSGPVNQVLTKEQVNQEFTMIGNPVVAPDKKTTAYFAIYNENKGSPYKSLLISSDGEHFYDWGNGVVDVCWSPHKTNGKSDLLAISYLFDRSAPAGYIDLLTRSSNNAWVSTQPSWSMDAQANDMVDFNSPNNTITWKQDGREFYVTSDGLNFIGAVYTGKFYNENNQEKNNDDPNPYLGYEIGVGVSIAAAVGIALLGSAGGSSTNSSESNSSSGSSRNYDSGNDDWDKDERRTREREEQNERWRESERQDRERAQETRDREREERNREIDQRNEERWGRKEPVDPWDMNNIQNWF